MLRRYVLALVSIGSVLGLLTLGSQHATNAKPSATVTPAEALAGQIGTWRVRVTVGAEGIAQGGGLRVQLPDKWHFRGRNSAKGVHSIDPTRKNYVSAHCSSGDVQLDCVIEQGSTDEFNKGARRGVNGVPGRYAYVARCTIRKGSLQAGDWLEVVYGDRSGGSPGFVASRFAANAEPIQVALDAAGTGNWKLLDDLPTLTTHAGRAQALRLTAPSNAVVGEPLSLHVALLDAAQNPTADGGRRVQLFVNRGRADEPEDVHLKQDGPGWARLTLVPRHEGILRIGGRTADSTLWALSNPVRVNLKPPGRKVYWGDLHSHSQVSWDGIGNGDAAFRYARDVSSLDFYCRTDHSGANLGQTKWEQTRELTERFYVPGRFATIYGYECSFGAPYAHHNVYFRGLEGLLRAPGGSRRGIPGEPPRVTLPELWDQLREGEAITVPHHTGCFSLPDWSRFRNDAMRPLIEIYSLHGTAEYFDPGHPLAYDQSDGRPHAIEGTAGAKDGPYFAQDLWDTGQRAGAIGSSDDHRSQPGRPQMGLAAVFATELTREAIFDALRIRRAYGTTGERILLDFQIDNTPMGSEVRAAGPPTLAVWAHGTEQISLIEVLRRRAKENRWQVIDRKRPLSEQVEFTLQDRDWGGQAIYYVRLRQVNLVRGRLVMAWSSPIWVAAR